MNRITYGWKYGGIPNARWVYGYFRGIGWVAGVAITDWFLNTGFKHTITFENRELGCMMTIVIPDDIEYRLFCMAFPDLAS